MDERVELAEAFLQEAVFVSRAKQAAGTSFAATGGGAGQCGLGAQAEVALDLSPRAAEIAARLWPQPLAPARVELIRSVATDWVELQDALDRKRNHFLKEFRQRHGFDRSAYTPEQRAEFERGLARINAEVGERRRALALQLV